MRHQFIPQENIERIALGDFARYKDQKGNFPLSFPLDPEDVFHTLFGLTTEYIDFDQHGLAAAEGEELLGCLYPEGQFFHDDDKLILVNCTVSEQMQRFTAFHEGAHYALHVWPTKNQKELFGEKKKDLAPSFCRTNQVNGKQYDPIEYQANRYAAAMMMPSKEVFRVVDENRVVDLDIYGERLKKHFGVSQMAMEIRLHELGYRYANGKYGGIPKEGNGWRIKVNKGRNSK